MFETLFTTSPWLALALAMVVTGLDLALTIIERAQYHGGAKDVILIEGARFRLERPYQPGAGWGQFWGRRYTLYLIGTAAAVVFAWFLFHRWNNLPQVFVFGMGGLLLYELVEISRLLYAVNLLRYARLKRGVKGKVEVAAWVPLNLSVVDEYTFGLVYLLAFLASGSWFFLGGAATCFILGHGLRDYVSFWRKTGKASSRRML